MIKVTVGTEVWRLRQQAKLSQEELSIQSDVTLSFVKSIELGHGQPTVTTLFKLAKALRVTPDRLIMPCWQLWEKKEHED